MLIVWNFPILLHGPHAFRMSETLIWMRLFSQFKKIVQQSTDSGCICRRHPTTGFQEIVNKTGGASWKTGWQAQIWNVKRRVLTLRSSRRKKNKRPLKLFFRQNHLRAATACYLGRGWHRHSAPTDFEGWEGIRLTEWQLVCCIWNTETKTFLMCNVDHKSKHSRRVFLHWSTKQMSTQPKVKLFV